RIVQMPELFLIPWRPWLLLEGLGINGCLSKTRSRRSRRPEAGMMRRQMPRARATHRKAADRNPFFVDRILRLHMFDPFEHIGLPRKLKRVAEPAIRVQHDCICGSEIAQGALAVANKFQLGQPIVATMQPYIEPVPLPGT